MDSMNMTDSSGTSSDNSTMSTTMTMMMKPYLHFTRGDTLLFDTIVPTSAGAIFGACLILFLISVGERYLRAVVRGVERRFTERSKHLETKYHFDVTADSADQDPTAPAPTCPPAAPQRFILSHEVSRGVLAGLQSTLHYLLMLIAMTFNAAFIISIILGVVVGEIAFGRLYRYH
ncbi:Ctr copper transporter [Roridomyces roridus]|uniref:Copper transport protein n=1 Tax=Roridomyces roridus TaxID=1738132 RepID=A0AAD7FIY1_9AGAR|nr:Ctr copper transporter [Roridomyces roridus]